MNRVIAATKLDFLASLTFLRQAVMLMAIAVVIGSVTHSPDYAMMLTMVFGVTSCGSIFSVHEKCHSDRLYGILPIRRREMILGRYLYALIIGVAYIVLAAIIGLVLGFVINHDFSLFTFWTMIAIGFGYFCFAAGIAYPIYFRFSFAKAYVFTMLPMYLIVVAFLIVTRRTNLLDSLSQFHDFFVDKVFLLPILGIIAGLLMLTVSMRVANLIYSRKEI